MPEGKWDFNARACSTNVLDFRTLPPVQSTIESCQMVEYPCSTSLPKDDQTPLEFRIDRTDSYIDLNRTFLCFSVKVQTKDGASITSDCITAPINNFAYSMFDNVEIYLDGQKITESDSLYTWTSYIYNLLYTSDNTKATYLSGCCWADDKAGLMDTITKKVAEGATPGVSNPGFDARYDIIADGKRAYMCARLFSNTMVDRLIPPQTEVLVRFTRAKPTLTLMSDSGEYKIKVMDATLLVNRVKLADAYASSYERMLSSSGFLYPVVKIATRAKTVSKGDQNVEWIPFTGVLPQRIYIFQTLQSAFNGELKYNPFNFQTFNMERLRVFKNEICLPSSQGLYKMSEDNFLKPYLATLQGVNSPETFDIKKPEYVHGYFVIVLDISNDGNAACEYDNPSQNGTLRLSIDYSSPLKSPVTLFCIGETNGVFKLMGNREVVWEG